MICAAYARARTKPRDGNKRSYYAKRAVTGSTIFARVVTCNMAIELAYFENLCNAKKESSLVLRKTTSPASDWKSP